MLLKGVEPLAAHQKRGSSGVKLDAKHVDGPTNPVRIPFKALGSFSQANEVGNDCFSFRVIRSLSCFSNGMIRFVSEAVKALAGIIASESGRIYPSVSQVHTK